MALQSSGTISLANVNQELGRASNSQISLNVFLSGGIPVVQTGSGNININQCSSFKPDASAPTSLNEWYSYNHSASCGGGCTGPCLQNSGVNYSGEGSTIIIYQRGSTQSYCGYTSYFWESESAARANYGVPGQYGFNPVGLFDSNGTTNTSLTIPEIGHLIINLGAQQAGITGKCGYIVYHPSSTAYILGLDASGKIVSKVFL